MIKPLTDIYKSKDLKTGNCIIGPIQVIGDRYYILNSTTLISGALVSYAEVVPTFCAKKIATLLNKTDLFEYDVFETQSGKQFFITFDYARLAIVYHSVNDETLPDGINIYECTYIGNVIVDSLFKLE